MTGGLTLSVWGLLTWMKEHHSEGYVALDAIATPFRLNQDSMLRNLQWLQRYECVQRGGRENAAWSITDQGVVRLAEGRFSLSGALLSPFDLAGGFAGSHQDQARQSTESTVSTPLE